MINQNKKAIYISTLLTSEESQSSVENNSMILASSVEEVEDRCFELGVELRRLKIMPWKVIDTGKENFFLVEVAEIDNPKTRVYMVSSDTMSAAANLVQTDLDKNRGSSEQIREINPLEETLL